MIKAVIFDMDGLMFDTERLAVEGWVYAGKQMGYNITKELVTKTCGSRIEDTKRIFLEHLGNDIDFYGCRKVRVDYAEKYIADNGLPLKPGLIELLDFLSSNNYKIALASSTEKQKVEHYLKSVGILKYFNSLICGDMVEKGKPQPDIYLKAAEALGVLPTECIALEDSLMGILSAYRAGLKPVMIPDLTEPDEETSKMLYAKLPTLLEVIDLLKKQ
jgi:HAD superfamily hydrolase (TIGR01509 family)